LTDDEPEGGGLWILEWDGEESGGVKIVAEWEGRWTVLVMPFGWISRMELVRLSHKIVTMDDIADEVGGCSRWFPTWE